MDRDLLRDSTLKIDDSEFDSDFFKRLLSNKILKKLPKHLLQFIVDQNYQAYTPMDHAVWRYVLRQSHRFLIEHAHKIYFKGLEKTGLKVDAIPSIHEMNDILIDIGWAAVPVDGFIPPAAFMEFQANRVLPIASDMRQIEHIEYTPSPDIIHEAAGHAPVIADSEYAEYLRRVGVVGSKAMSSKKDYALYEVIRKLSILKETPGVPQAEINRAEDDVLTQQKNLGIPSEMAKLSRLHWWTVEYGLVGSLDNPKIYGAGLLSSIGEAVHCFSDEVKKTPYDINAIDYPFDITTMQPQLFVTPDFSHLITVLEEFANTMSFRIGGIYGLNKAIECKNPCTAVYSSRLQVSGIFTNVLSDENDNPIYIRTMGKSNLSIDGKELPGHGVDYHSEGFGSPVGKLKDVATALEALSDTELKEQTIEVGKTVKLTFTSGLRIGGSLAKVERRKGKIILMTFHDCRVSYQDHILFEPSWGIYDMAVGESIVSVFSGAADKVAYEQASIVSKMRVIKFRYDVKRLILHKHYQTLRDIRNGKRDSECLLNLWEELKRNYPEDWLLATEILEFLVDRHLYPELEREIRSSLEDKREDKKLAKLIQDGIFLTYNPLKYR